MTATIIADNIRRLRSSRAWTQEQLTQAAALDVRTIQRAEKGHLLAAETLQALAGAFDEPVASLSLPTPDIDRLVADFKAKTALITMTAVERASALGDLIGRAQAFDFERCGLASDVEDDAAAEFEQLIRDSLDLWNDLEPVQRRDVEKTIQGQVNALAKLNLTVTAGMERQRIRFGTGDNMPMEIGVLYIAVAPAARPALLLMRQKGGTMGFK
jgi:transcriptional regulator with XRE-family HTH domain